MKKLALVLVLLLILSCCSRAGPFLTENLSAKAETSFKLPASLMVIEDSAFEGTAAEAVELPDSLISIGERAFADSNLRAISIPESVEYIAEHAFDGTDQLTISGVKGSYAENWANEHNVVFIRQGTAAAWQIKLKKLFQNNMALTVTLSFLSPGITLRRRRRTGDSWRSMRPQDRIELYPVNYKFP